MTDKRNTETDPFEDFNKLSIDTIDEAIWGLLDEIEEESEKLGISMDDALEEYESISNMDLDHKDIDPIKYKNYLWGFAFKTLILAFNTKDYRKMIFFAQGCKAYGYIHFKGNKYTVSEIASMGGIARAANDPKQKALDKIEADFKNSTYPFHKHGYKTKFAREMQRKYPELDDTRAIMNRINYLLHISKGI